MVLSHSTLMKGQKSAMVRHQRELNIPGNLHQCQLLSSSAVAECYGAKKQLACGCMLRLERTKGMAVGGTLPLPARPRALRRNPIQAQALVAIATSQGRAGHVVSPPWSESGEIKQCLLGIQLSEPPPSSRDKTLPSHCIIILHPPIGYMSPAQPNKSNAMQERIVVELQPKNWLPRGWRKQYLHLWMLLQAGFYRERLYSTNERRCGDI